MIDLLGLISLMDLIYMSIENRLIELKNEEELVAFKAPKGFKSKRALFISKSVMNEILKANSNVGFHNCRPHIEAVFDNWVKGVEVAVSLGGSGKGALLARLDPPPPNIWELRVTDPSPQFRVFCMFAAKDILVATQIENRNVLGSKQTKTGKKSAAWTKIMQDCNNEWVRLFPNNIPFDSANLDEMMTGGKNAVRY